MELVNVVLLFVLIVSLSLNFIYFVTLNYQLTKIIKSLFNLQREHGSLITVLHTAISKNVSSLNNYKKEKL